MSLDAVVARLEKAFEITHASPRGKVATRLEAAAAGGGGGGGGGSGGGGGGGGDASSPAIEAFDEYLAGPFKTFVDKSAALGQEVSEITPAVEQAFKSLREFLVIVSQSKKPDEATFQGLLGPMSAKIGEVQSFKEKNFRSKQSNHLAGLAEGMPCLGWVTMVPKPCPYIKEMRGAAEFYTNKVLKEFNNTDGGKPQVEWARSWIAALSELEKYVKDHHTTGPAWNPRGGDAKAAKPAPAPAPAPAASTGGGGTSTGAPSGSAKLGLLSELSKGGAVTSGLKKVDKSQMTHKNPALRAGAVVPAGAVAPKAAPAAAKKTEVKKPPVLELQGKKWDCSYQDGNKGIIIETEGANQTIYIFKCTNSVIQVKGKVNAITLDGCKKTSIVFGDCVAAFEVINSTSVQCQTTGKVQTISIDKTDGAQIYLSKESIDASVVTAKSSEVNVSIPNLDDPEGDMIECPVPEQFKSVWNPKTKKLETTMTESI